MVFISKPFEVIIKLQIHIRYVAQPLFQKKSRTIKTKENRKVKSNISDCVASYGTL